ncbi:hypothetical protein K474DRAFT_1712265 [Panus rudis PR-1116 ss-1]|nr:hypothetical protein K474DRAFT_1712265 [Panus rudis PR-1116 ss-1]
MSNSNDNSQVSAGASTTGLAIGVSISVLLVLTIALAGYVFCRRRQARKTHGVNIEAGRRETVVDPLSLAARVTPFSPNTTTEGPRFHHRPGEGMRVATRRSDGGWDFSQPLTLQVPATSPFADSNSVASSPISPISPVYKKEKVRPGELTTRGFIEVDADGIPPPAYSISRTSLGSHIV